MTGKHHIERGSQYVISTCAFLKYRSVGRYLGVSRLGPLAGYVLVWAGFIAWGCYFHSGGDSKALTKTICGNIYGVVIAWIALLDHF